MQMIVFLEETETDLQSLLDALSDWCGRNGMTVNRDKSNAVHFRQNSVPKTDAKFSNGDEVISITDRYTHLGVILAEHLDYNIMVKHVASRPGLLIAKCKIIGGFHIVYSPSCMILSFGQSLVIVHQFGVLSRTLV